MNDDMRLKSVVVKGPIATALPCMFFCAKSEKCPCQALQKYWKNQSKGATSIEMEWMHVASWRDPVFWTKMLYSLTIIALLIVVVHKLMCFVNPPDEKKDYGMPFKMSITESGYTIEYPLKSISDFEQGTNDIVRVKKGLHLLCTETKND